jgi:hypothetical protein
MSQLGGLDQGRERDWGLLPLEADTDEAISTVDDDM